MRPQPAVISGLPAFEEMLPFIRPSLPPPASILAEARVMLETGMLTKGEHLERFEQAVAEHLGVRHAIGVSSCTTGLMLTYQALGLTGEVVVPSFTFMASVSSLVWAGLRPVFADVEYKTATVDVDSVARAITPRTSAIVAVHTFGNPACIDDLQDLAERHGLKLVFDAAHGFGANYQGQPIGSQGSANVFSLSPTKLLVAGEGGIVATDDDSLAERIRIGREYGNDGSYDSIVAGFNARMGEFNALLGYHSLAMLEDVAVHRNHVARLYQQLLKDVPGIEFMEVAPGNRCSYKDLSIAVNAEQFGLYRDELAAALTVENVDTRKYYWPAVHCHTAYRYLNADESLLANTIRLADASLSLPVGIHITDDVVGRVCDAIKSIHEHAAATRLALGRARLNLPVPSSASHATVGAQ